MASFSKRFIDGLKEPLSYKHYDIIEFLNWVHRVIPATLSYNDCSIIYPSVAKKILAQKYSSVGTHILKEFGYGDYGSDDKLQFTPNSWYHDEGTFLVYFHSYFDADTIETETFIFYNDEEVVLDLFKTLGSRVDPLKPGVYYLKETPGGPQFVPLKVSDIDKPILVDNFEDTIIKDIETFFKSEQFYKDHNFPYKRGLLLYGSAGTGKTSAVKYVGGKVNMPVIILDERVDLSGDKKELINMLCPDGCILVIEDIDGVESHKRSELLNFLDGIGSPYKCYIIATTNYLENVDFAFKNRPSRFDMVIEVGVPDTNTRKQLIQRFFGEKTKEFDIDKVVTLTKGYTGAYIKELFILYSLNNYTIEEAVKQLDLRLSLASRQDNDHDDMYV